MEIMLTGATGFIGPALCEALVQKGHTLRVLSRNAQRAKKKLPQVAKAFDWDGLSPLDEKVLEGCDAVIHLAGESVAGRWNSRKKKAIYESRVVSTRNIVQAMKRLEHPPKILLNANAVGYYGTRGDEVLTEASSPGKGFLAEVCTDWEKEALQAEAPECRVVILRIGLVMGANGGPLEAMLTPFKMGVGGPLGNGKQWWPWIHKKDVIGLLLHALEQEQIQGVFHLTAPNPVRQKEFAKTLGRALKRPAFFPAPAFGMRLVLGEFASDVLASQRVLPQKALATGYTFQFEDLESALRQILNK